MADTANITANVVTSTSSTANVVETTVISNVEQSSAVVANVIAGGAGAAGAAGVGVPVGGTTNQVLAKINSTDYNTQWVDQTGGGGSGTVTTISVVTANGISGSVANATTTPAITLTLGAITPSSVNGVALSGASTPTLAVTGTSTISGSNTGDQTSVTGNAGTATKWATARNLAGNSVDGSANVPFANKFIVQGTADAGLSAAQFMGALGTGIVKNTTTTGVLSIAVAADFPTLNQSTAGNAATATLAATATALATTRAINGVNFDGTAAITVPSIVWTIVTGTSQTAAVNNGYITNNAGLVTVTLPSTAAVGSMVEVAGQGAGGWKVAQAASVLIHFGNTTTTTGTGGSLASVNAFDTVRLLCIVANTTWVTLSSVGNLTVV